MNSNRKLPIVFAPLVLGVGALLADGPAIVNGRRVLVLEGDAVQLVVDLAGGSIADFHLRSGGLNPLQWGNSGPGDEPRARGHFLCLDRWGAPSDAEQKNGMPFHGESAHVLWQVEQAPTSQAGTIRSTLTAVLPMAGLHVKRRIQLSARSAFFVVTEEVTNANKLGRLFNMVQHPTIGPPFLDEQTVVDANGGRGFMQNSPLPNPEQPPVHWPNALHDGRNIDIRRLTNDHNPNVVSYVVDDEFGWVTASSPTQGLLIGYLWKKTEYPWFNAWRHVEQGKPLARGLEFGTTGLHQPFPVLVAKGKIFDRPLYEYLDANETRSKTYACFLFKIPKTYRGVARVNYDGKQLLIYEHEATAGQPLSMETGALF